MKKLTSILVVCATLSMFLVACGTNGEETDAGESALPSGIPSDFPFPGDADLDVTSNDMSGGKQHIVGFSFTDDADAMYDEFKTYATSKGYTVATENKDDYRFSAVNDSSEGLVVSLSDMGAVKIATVTFTAPAE